MLHGLYIAVQSVLVRGDSDWRWESVVGCLARRWCVMDDRSILYYLLNWQPSCVRPGVLSFLFVVCNGLTGAIVGWNRGCASSANEPGRVQIIILSGLWLSIFWLAARRWAMLAIRCESVETHRASFCDTWITSNRCSWHAWLVQSRYISDVEQWHLDNLEPCRRLFSSEFVTAFLPQDIHVAVPRGTGSLLMLWRSVGFRYNAALGKTARRILSVRRRSNVQCLIDFLLIS